MLNTSFTYADAPLPEAYQDLTADYLVGLLGTLKPRVAFETVRREYYAKPEIHAAIEQLLDRRLNALAYTAKLQRHITAADYQRFTRLRRGTDAQLRASSVALNGYVLKDLWLLRESDEQGGLTRLLLCTPKRPRPSGFMVSTQKCCARPTSSRGVQTTPCARICWSKYPSSPVRA